ncbi:hypothetical protein TrRE_jg5263, partial [Triparma retinervis]
MYSSWSATEADHVADHVTDHNTDHNTEHNTDHDEELREKRNKATRFRQHVNPLSRKYQVSPSDFTWMSSAFSSPSLPLHLDVGCAKGTFCLDLALSNPGALNVLGLEIRPPVVEYALGRRDKRKLDNCHFLACNANVDIKAVIEGVVNNGGRVK